MCQDGFTSESATAICKEMGFDAASTWRYGLLWPSRNYSISLDDIGCSSTDWKSDCTYSATNDSDCNHTEDVFLSCGRECPPGQYRRSGQCIPCPANTYKSNKGIQTSCTNCPTSSTSEPNSVCCTCEAGQFWNKTRCQSCTEGSASPVGAVKCTTCPPDSRSLYNRSSCACEAGKFWVWSDPDGICASCPQGTYKSKTMDSCSKCPGKKASSTAGSDRCTCTAGKFWNETLCQSCSKGSVSPEGAVNCTKCLSDQTANTARTMCTCPTGHRWSWINQSNGSCLPLQQSIREGEAMTKWIRSIILASVLLAMLLPVIGFLLFHDMRKKRKNKRGSPHGVSIIVQNTEGQIVHIEGKEFKDGKWAGRQKSASTIINSLSER